MADIIIRVASEIAKYVVAPIGRQLGYMFKYDSNFEDLKNQLNELEDVENDVKQNVDAATRNRDKIKPRVEKWLEGVNGITEEARKILDHEDKAKKRCFNGLCPNLKTRYQLSKKAKMTAAEVICRIQDGENFGRVTHPEPPLQGIESTPNKDYEAFESRMSTLTEIMEVLKNPSVAMIGIYGMGGAGKTMLVEEVARKAKEEKLFDVVVTATVSQTPNIRTIQGVIAYKLGFKFDQETEFGWADRLRDRLKKEKSILVILDDIWAKLDLKAVGIPFGDDHKGCNIVVTSRCQHVLSNDMNIEKQFGIGVLLEEEGWNLFKKMAGDSVDNPELKPTAIDVAKECAGLPLAIAVVANALKNKDLPVWKNALQELKLSIPTNIPGMDPKVYSSLKLSYKFLESEEAKSLFLLCSLFPEDYHISIQDLIRCGKGLGLFQGINTLEHARNRVHTLVHHLKASCLLLDSDSTNFVRVHDVVRDVSISIASKDKHMLIMRNDGELEECMTEGKLKLCLAISLPYSDIYDLPTGLEFPKLKFFLFFSNDPFFKIPDTFFEGMKRLRVLNLKNTCFSSLPSSLHFLSNLQTLCLDQCTFRDRPICDLAIIGELKKLEVLSFVSSDIEELPGEMGRLTRLKLLDLKDCSKLKVIPSNLIASLSQLEDLYMENSFVEWEVDGNVSLVELTHLSRLVTLDIHILDAKILPEDLCFEKLLRYRIFIGDGWDWSGEYKTSRTLKLKLNTRIQQELGIQSLLKGTEDLYLEELKDIRSVLYDLDREGFPQLKHLHVQQSCEIECVINTMECFPTKAFPNLESLFLQNLINLKEICQGQIPSECFSNLKSVNVEDCGGLKNLFSLSIARRLSQLQELEISECENMDEIVGEGREGSKGTNEAMDKIIFPQLRLLILDSLPKLTSFYSKGTTRPSLNYTLTIDARSGEIISEGEHDIPIPLFNEKVAFPNLEELVIQNVNSLKEIWPSQLLVDDDSFCNLKSFSVQSCEHLLNIIPSNMLMRLQNMERLSVYECGGSLEYIFDLGGLNDKGRHLELRDLDIENLPGLKQIWKKDPQTNFLCQKLSSLQVSECGNLRSIITTSMVKSLKQLQKLSITKCEMVDEIVEEEGVEEQATDKIVFPQLTSLTLEDLPKLKSFCQGSYISEWPSSKKLDISGSDSGEIFALESSSFEEMHGKDHLGTPTKQPLFLVDKVAFPNLEALSIQNVNFLKEIWPSQLLVHDDSFCKLKSLRIVNGEHLSNIVPSNMLMRLRNLESLQVWGRNILSVEYIFDVGELNGMERHVGRATPLRRLMLDSLPELKQIWKTDSQLSGYFSFQNLTSLKVTSCHKLKHIFTTSIAKSLVQLQELQIEYSKDVEEIIGNEVVEENSMGKIVFPRLTSLTLDNLKQLKSFCQGILKERFSLELSSFEESSVKGHVGTPTKPLFLVDKVGFPNLVVLDIVNVNSLKEIWPSQLPVDDSSFCNLKFFNVKCCEYLLNIIPSSMLMRLQNMERLSVYKCGGSLEYIFDLGGLNDKRRHAELRDLDIGNLPGLKQIWKKDPQTNFPCQKLSSLQVSECGNLRSIVTTSIVKSLNQLQNLSIKKCEMVEEIVEEEGVEEQATDKIVVPQLTSLTLVDLPQLKSFYQGSHISEWPSSKKLDVSGSNNVEIFALESSSFQEIRGKDHLGTPTKQLLFMVDKVAFPNLNELTVENLANMKEIWQGQLDAPAFCKLRVLTVKYCHKILKVFPIRLLQNLPNLEVVSVFDCDSLEEVFELGGVCGEVGHAGILPWLMELSLIRLPKLMHVWKKDFQLSPVFQNLTIIDVQGCESLSYVLPFTIAKSLAQIKSITVWHCEMMKEIISSEEGEAIDHVTTFSQLNFLYLEYLPNLTSFYPESNTLSFPSLNYVWVNGCPKMKTFSNGNLTTPNLKRVTGFNLRGDLNSTIQDMFKQKKI